MYSKNIGVILYCLFCSFIGFSQEDEPANWSFTGGVGLLLEELGTVIANGPNDPDVYTSKVESFLPSQESNFNFGERIFVGSLFSLNEWQVPIELSVNFWQLKLSGTTVDHYKLSEESYNNGSWTSTNWDATRTTNFNYQNNSTFISFSIGLGYSVLDLKSRFSIVPMIRFSPEFLYKQKVVKDEGTWEMLEVYNAGLPNETSTTTTGESTDIDSKLDIFYKPQLSAKSFMEILRTSISVKFGFELMEGLDLSLEVGYKLQSTYRILMDDYGQKNTISSMFAVTYLL